MRAIVCHEFKSYTDHKVETIEAPALKPGHVRIAVEAAGVNFPDILMTEGKYQIKPPFPFVPGAECAGVITELADDVPYLKVGDRVGTMVMNGAFATEVVAPMMVTWPLGDMPFDVAAGLALVYGTSYYALKQRAQLKAGETLLVLGAAGGVGLAAVELGKAMGATVIAAASTAEKLAVCREHGADHLINYSEEDLKSRVKELGGADVIYDPVGDKFAEPAMRTLKWYGRYMVIGFAGGEIPKIPLNLALLKSIDIRGVFWGTWTMKDPKGHRENMGEIMEMVRSGTIKPRISGHYPLDDFVEAFDELANRRAMGKVILTMT
ncbi:NADPH:quinone oxidoreductase family protein [Litorimonas sp. RW-G-Af-16]|uniref:NADPH:quinone oxidoreductase family protein n=1 Tax=Litorimonas sp. RW-G-Af-16 TaxID=3241168 RepID=UPI00390C7060